MPRVPKAISSGFSTKFCKYLYVHACYMLFHLIYSITLIIISSTNFNAQFSLFINNMFVTLLSSTCFEH